MCESSGALPLVRPRARMPDAGYRMPERLSLWEQASRLRRGTSTGAERCRCVHLLLSPTLHLVSAAAPVPVADFDNFSSGLDRQRQVAGTAAGHSSR